jgi:regulator of sigma E protease
MSIVSLVQDALYTIIPFLFVLTFVVFVHEFGHFIIGRWCGVKVDVFSLGFGPALFEYRDSKDTIWRLSAIPLGGYVKFFGDANSASVSEDAAVAAMSEAERKIAFPTQHLAKRAAIVAAGPIANFILAVVIFTLSFLVAGMTIIEPRIGEVRAGEPAMAAGFRVGDLILSIDGRTIDSWADMQRIVQGSADLPLHFMVKRGDEHVAIDVTPRQEEIKSRLGINRFGLIGLVASTGPEAIRHEPLGVGQSFVEAGKKVYFIIERTISYIGGVIAGREKADQISGPVRIAQISGVMAQIGFGALLELAAILSVSIGFMNLLPIPLLDGGHLLFYALEAVSGGPINPKLLRAGYGIGLALVLSLMIFATFNDISFLLTRK